MDEDDIIDLGTMEVVVDRGVLRNSRPGSFAIGRFSLPGSRARRGKEEDEGDRAPWEEGEESEEDVMGCWGDREGQPSVQFREERRRQREEERDLKEFLEENRRVEGAPAEESGSDDDDEVASRGNELLEVQEEDEAHKSSDDDEMTIGPSPPKRSAVAAPVSPPRSRSPPSQRNPPSTTKSLRAAVTSLGLSTSPPKPSSSPLKRRASLVRRPPSPPHRATPKSSFSLIIPTRRSIRAVSAFPLSSPSSLPLSSPTKKPPSPLWNPAFPSHRQLVTADNLDVDTADLLGPEEMSFEMLERLLDASDSEDRRDGVESEEVVEKGGVEVGTGLSTPPVSKRSLAVRVDRKGKGREVVEEESEDELDSLSPAKSAASSPSKRLPSPAKPVSSPKRASSPAKRASSPIKRASSPAKPSLTTRSSSPIKFSSPAKSPLPSTRLFPRISPELGLPMTPPPSRGYSRGEEARRKDGAREGLRSAGSDEALDRVEGGSRGGRGEESEDELMLR